MLDRKWVRRFDEVDCSSWNEEEGEESSLGYFKLIGLFGILGVGMAAAAVAGVVEVILRPKTAGKAVCKKAAGERRIQDLVQKHGIECDNDFVRDLARLIEKSGGDKKN